MGSGQKCSDVYKDKTPYETYLPSQNKYHFCLEDFILFIVFNATFSYIMATSFSGGRSQSTWREAPSMGKQLVKFITCGCESSAPFCNLQSRARTHAVLAIKLYELLGNPTT